MVVVVYLTGAGQPPVPLHIEMYGKVLIGGANQSAIKTWVQVTIFTGEFTLCPKSYSMTHLIHFKRCRYFVVPY